MFSLYKKKEKYNVIKLTKQIALSTFINYPAIYNEFKNSPKKKILLV